MRRTLLHIALLLLFAIQVKADNLGYSKDNPMIFGIDMDYAPMEYVDAEGLPHGLDVDFTKKLMKRLDIPFTYAPNTWQEIAGDVLNGRVDLGMMVYSPYRKDITNYSRAVFRLYYQMVYRKEELHQREYGLRDIHEKTIALMESRPIIDTLTKAGATIHIVKDLKNAMIELSEGKYDALICFRYQANYLITQNNLKGLVAEDLALMPREYCYVSHDKKLIEAINSELYKMEEDGVIDEVYGQVKSNFGGIKIPRWVWALVTGLFIFSLVSIIIVQRRARKRLVKEMERAQKSEELKDIFLNNMSHALRTPLNAIIGFSDLMLTTPDEDMSTGERQQLMELINTNGLQLLHLINELLSLSDIEGNSQLFNRQVTDVDYEMATYAAEIRQQLPEGVSMEVVEPVGGIRALVDQKLMRLVTMHLLENALQHTKEGKITLAYYVKEDGLYTEVKDTGSGLPEKLKANIFALLSDKNTYVQDETPGLGLSICKAILDRCNGKIGARDNDEDGKGTVVWYWSPTKILS